jgi:hypothetical protein
MSAPEKFLFDSNMTNDRGVNYFSVVYTGRTFFCTFRFLIHISLAHSFIFQWFPQKCYRFLRGRFLFVIPVTTVSDSSFSNNFTPSLHISCGSGPQKDNVRYLSHPFQLVKYKTIEMYQSKHNSFY